MDNVKDEFISALIDELNEENKYRIGKNKSPINVCFMVAALDQQLDNCKEFIEVLKNRNWVINGYEYDEDDYYTNGKIRVLIEKSEDDKESEYLVDVYENYCYYIEFLRDQRHWGYCFCDEDTEGYNQKYKCSGVSCDWTAPAFRITKEIDMHYAEWQGYEKDYWAYREGFDSNGKNKREEVERYKKEQEKEYILNHIRELQEKLAKLNN